MKIIRTFFTYVVCGPALFMPCKLRILYAEFIGWIVQCFYFIYFYCMRKILNELKNGQK